MAHEEWPKWMYGPSEGDAQIFDREEDVPAGWTDRPGGAMAQESPEAARVRELQDELTELRAELAEARRDAKKAEQDKAEEANDAQQKREGDENNGTTDADDADEPPVWEPKKMTNEPTPETTGSPLPQSLMSPEIPNDPRKRAPGRPKKGS
jgi:hypothetical protein